MKSSIGIVVVTHAGYGSALLRAAEFIIGPIQDCVSVQVDVERSVEETVTRLQEAVGLLDSGAGVLILTDMFGGTSTNLSLALLGTEYNVDVITGVNLPMLLKSISHRGDMTLGELSGIAKKAGLEGIIAAGELLRSKPHDNNANKNGRATK